MDDLGFLGNSSVNYTVPLLQEDPLLLRILYFGPTSYVITAIYLCIVGVIGTLSNGVIMYLYFKDKSLRSPMNLLFVNLAMSDFTVAFFGAMFQFGLTCTRKYMSPGMALCDFYGFITFLGGLASEMNLFIISVERYLAVVRPFDVGNLTNRRVIAGGVFVWLYSLVFAGGPLVGWSSYRPEGLGTWCSISWQDRSMNTMSYVTAVFLGCYFFPVGIIIFCYFNVWRKVKEAADAQGGAGTAGKAEKSIFRMSVIMVTCYLTAWTPYAIVCLIASYGPPNGLPIYAEVLPSLFAKSSQVYNPIIYVLMNKPYRSALVSLVCRGRNPFDEAGGMAGGTTAKDETLGKGNKVAAA